MIRLTRDQIMELLDADWLSEGPIGLNESPSLSDRFLSPKRSCASECLLSGVKRTFASCPLDVRL